MYWDFPNRERRKCILGREGLCKDVKAWKGIVVSVNDTKFREPGNRAQREQAIKLEKYAVYQLPIAA